MRCTLDDHEWAAIKPMLPNKPRGVPRVNDHRVLDRLRGCVDDYSSLSSARSTFAASFGTSVTR